MNDVAVGLMCGKYQHFGYLDVLWSRSGIESHVGDVGSGKRLDAFIHLVGTLVVAMEAHVAEVGLYESRLEVGDAYSRVSYVDAQTVRNRLYGSLCGAIHIC